MGLIDTHTHLDFPDFDADRPALLANARAVGVERMVVLGVHQANWQRVWDLVQSDPQLYAAFGLHPVYLDEHLPAHLAELRDWLGRLAGHPQLCGWANSGWTITLKAWTVNASKGCLRPSLGWRLNLNCRCCCMCVAAMPR